MPCGAMASFSSSSHQLSSCSFSLVLSSAFQSTPVSRSSFAISSRAYIFSEAPIFDPQVSRGPSFDKFSKKSSVGCPQFHTISPVFVNRKLFGGLCSKRSSRSLVPILKSSQETEVSSEAEASKKEDDELAERGAIAAITVGTVAPELDAVSKVLETVQEEEAADEAIGESFIGEELAAIYAKCQIWLWKKEYPINYVVQGSGPAVVLVHGFGASIGHWRRNIGVLSETNTVYALDLLGLGASAKPPQFAYSMETWAELLTDFMKEIVGSPAVLVGNSIGSLACLLATAEAPDGLVRGTVLLNCAGGMNNKAITDDWRLKLALPLLWLIDFLLKRPSIATWLFNRVRSRANIKNVLQSVYNNKAAVDDELVEIILSPADSPGALDAFVSIITGPPGPKPQTLIPKISTPVLLIWGDDDPFTPIDGPVGKYFSALANSGENVQLFLLPNVGHCPHDDRPELVHEQLLPWLATLP